MAGCNCGGLKRSLSRLSKLPEPLFCTHDAIIPHNAYVYSYSNYGCGFKFMLENINYIMKRKVVDGPHSFRCNVAIGVK